VRAQISKTIIDLINYDLIVKSKTKEVIVSTERNNLFHILKSNITYLEIAKDTWKSFDDIDNFINKHISNNIEEFDVFIDFGLTRFSLLKCKEIQTLINDLIRSRKEDKNSQQYHLLKSNIIKTLIHSLRDVETRADDLIIPISVFWVFEEFKLIHRILATLNLDYKNLYQLAIIHAASIARMNTNTEKSYEILECIISKYKRLINYKPYIGISYVYYHLWKNKYKPIISKNNSDYNYSNSSEILKAMDYNDQAYFWLKKNKDKSVKKEILENRNRKYYYSLNNRIYFKSRSEFKYNIEQYHSEIATLEISYNDGKGIYWQPRFAHTLALAYYRASFNLESKTLLKTANRWIKIAEETMPIFTSDYIKLRELIEQNLQTNSC